MEAARIELASQPGIGQSAWAFTLGIPVVETISPPVVRDSDLKRPIVPSQEWNDCGLSRTLLHHENSSYFVSSGDSNISELATISRISLTISAH